MSSAQKTLVEDDVLDFESEDFTFSFRVSVSPSIRWETQCLPGLTHVISLRIPKDDA